MQAFRRSALPILRNVAAVQRRSYASSYADTVPNLSINKDTKVIFQGFTGKQGTYVLFNLPSNIIVVSSILTRLADSMLNKPLPTVSLTYHQC